MLGYDFYIFCIDIRLKNFRSDERLLPPQALQSKKQPLSASKRQSPPDGMSRKKSKSRERSEPVKSPMPEQQIEGSEPSAEDFSEIGESDEDILAQNNSKEEAGKE